MAKIELAYPENEQGNYFVDSTCIDCGACRYFAPLSFAAGGGHSFVIRQPTSAAERQQAQQALLSCPTASIGLREKTDLSEARKSLPLELAPKVYLNGFNHRSSFGSHSYLIESRGGNWLVDSPRFSKHLVRQFEARGGLDYVFLTHRDDVADAHKYARHFGAQRIIHAADREAQPHAEIQLEGVGPWSYESGQILFAPGHTRGHLVLLWKNKYLFTGDHLAWLPQNKKFRAFRGACWYSWDKQIESVARLAAHSEVEWVFPGHGKWAPVDKGQFPRVIEELVRWMKKVR